MKDRHLLIHIEDQSQVGELRRELNRLSVENHFTDTQKGRIAIVGVELANNILQHAKGGYVVIRQFEVNSISCIELLAIDNGPGMGNLSHCFRDGFSTSTTPGTGLGAVTRMSDVFDVFSAPGKGTVILSQNFNRRVETSEIANNFVAGVISVPYPRELSCGDGYCFFRSDHKIEIMVCDGLGHGVHAADASLAAMRSFSTLNSNSYSLSQKILELNKALSRTRGAAVGLATLDWENNKIDFCGIGNIWGCVAENAKIKAVVSHNGTVGMEVRKVQEFTYPISSDSVVIFQSDGISHNWNLEHYPGLSAKHPSVIAGILFRDFRRLNDDATILVLKKVHA